MTFDGKLGLAPPNDQNSDIKHVLDLGTETGVWAIDYAEEHPAAKVSSGAVFFAEVRSTDGLGYWGRPLS